MRLRKRGRTGHVITYDITPLLRIFALVTISICVVHQAGKMALGLILLISWPLSVACAARWERSSYVSVFVSSGKLQQIINIKVWETVVVVPPYIADFISLVLLYIKQPHYFIAGV